MKLRINKQSIRLRIDQDDLVELSNTGKVDEELGNEALGKFGFSLIRSDQTDIGAQISAGAIIITIPQAHIAEWVDTDRVGFEQEISGVRILLEKDFQCLTERPNENESRNFANPKSAH